MAVSRRKKLLREEKLKVKSIELQRNKKFASSVNIREFKEHVPSKKYYRQPQEVPSFTSTSAIYGTKKEANVYGGEYITGLATMHKSNIVPVGRDDDPKNYSTMRRN